MGKTLWLIDPGNQKVKVAKIIKDFYHLGDKATANLVNNTPISLPKNLGWKLDSLEKQLISIGCKAELLDDGATPKIVESNDSIIDLFTKQVPLGDNSESWFGEANQFDCFCANMPNDSFPASVRESVRKNFKIDFDENILFVRDTSFLDDRNQGLVMTDIALYHLIDNNHPHQIVRIPWTQMKRVEHKEFTLIFLPFNGSNSYQINISFFVKTTSEKKKLALITPIAEFLNKVIKLCNSDVRNLVEKYPSVINYTEQQKKAYINDLQYLLSKESITNANKARLFGTLSATYNLLNDKNNALKCINESLKLHDAYDFHVLKGIIMGCGRNSTDSYLAMQEILTRKEKDENHPFFSDEQIKKEFSNIQVYYAQHFLEISQQQRKHLVVCDELTYLPNSFRVLPISELPTDIRFPVGHPIANTLYVCHPYSPDYYFPYDSYSVDILRDEINEFCWLMECLGAKHIDFYDRANFELQKNKENKTDFKANVGYKGYSASGGYDKDSNFDEYTRLHEEIGRIKDFDIASKPFVPKNLVWYPHRKDWQDECESRLSGRLVRSKFTISTSSSELTTESERKKLEADLKILVASAGGSAETSKDVSLKKEQTRTWHVNVDFYPLSEYGDSIQAIVSPQITQISSDLPKQQNQNFIVWVMAGIILALVATMLAIIL